MQRSWSHTDQQQEHQDSGGSLSSSDTADICDPIRRNPRATASGVNCNTLHAFVDLVKLEDEALNDNIRQLFDLTYKGQVPQGVRRFFFDGYLFCLYKDPHDKTKLQSLGVPSTIRQLIASHVCRHGKARFALDLLPYNFAIGVPGGMNFLTKAMQLTVEQEYIQGPQDRGECPSRAIA
ncbi:hypothetical protein ACHAWF_008810 [Thalassiosira exigua]